MRRRVTLLDVLAHAMDGRERGLAILAAERSLARVLEEVSDERVFVPELDAANVARKEFLAFVNLEKLDRLGDMKNIRCVEIQQPFGMKYAAI